MAGTSRFELTSGSSDPSFVSNNSNGSRGNHAGPSLDRSGSFREGGENRMFGPVTSASRVSGAVVGNLPPLSKCLMLEPIVFGGQMCTRSGELRRVLGFSVGSASEENSFGAAHPRLSPPGVMEELKRYKESIIDVNNKARGRAKKLDEHIHKLNKYVEVVNSKKQQRNELSANERSGALNLKMGIQIPRNPTDLVSQRVDDRPKTAVLNKRVRTSVAETRAECRSNGLGRQSLVITKDRDMLKDASPGSDLVEEKIRRLPAGGEGWDKKMKRKRSVGNAFTRPLDSDGELKQPMHYKLSNESGLQSSDGHGFRSGPTNGISGTNKLDASSSPGSSFARATAKHDQEKSTLMRELPTVSNKEKLLAKGSNKLNICEDSHISPSPLTKGKASRTPRSGPVAAPNLSSSIPRGTGLPESWEQPSSGSKFHSSGGPNNRKRAMPSGSSSSPMAQWGGQRPQKRTRRANLLSPVSNHEEMQMSSEGCSPSDYNKINSRSMNGPLLFHGMANGNQQIKVKLENVSSPARFSESEESGAGDNRLREKVMAGGEVEEKVNAVQNTGLSSFFHAKKNKSVSKEEIGDGVRRQGRTGRASSFPVANISPVREKLDNTATTKPLRTTKPGSDKSGSKTGRPLKKLIDRKGFSRRGQIPHSSSPDFTGESDDDHEELLTAANLARNASYNACSGLFWKKVEPIFAPASLQDTSYFTQQRAEELHESLSQMFHFSKKGDLSHEEIPLPDTVGSGEIGRMQNKIESKESAVMEFTDQFHNFDTFCGKLDSEGRLNKATPLYQRVLSALIVEDEIEEFDENGVGGYAYNDLGFGTEPRKRDRMEFECESFATQTQKTCGGNRLFSCNGTNMPSRSVIHNSPRNDELWQEGSGFLHIDVGVSDGLTGNDLDGPQNVQTNGFIISPFDSQYEKMCVEDKLLLELQSIGIYLETVPDLDDTEDETIDQEMVQLKNGLHLQIDKKKAYLDKVHKAVEQKKEAEARELEQVAMDKLVELAHKKLLATRGSIASKYGIAKVSKQVALAFAKRTLVRCQAFEDSGTGCFNEPALRSVIFAPPLANEAEPSTGDCVGVGNRSYSGAEQHDPQRGSLDALQSFTLQSDQAFAKNGPISNRGKKKEILLDDVGGTAALRTTSTLATTLLGGAKGKRSERERDKDVSSRNTVAKAGRPSLSNPRGERKLKSKPKQKTAQLSTSGNGFNDKFTETSSHPVYPRVATNGSNNKREGGMMPPSTIHRDPSKESKEILEITNMPLSELDNIDELGIGTDLGWLNFDDIGLQDHDSAGLEIPMDDLSELNMF
ncbi:uncharacterized protein LOC127806014 isoform X2 [Diospyros lotus]|uniref:uncharacterized protein LOC127806014 isoform X2 n=1 Tax=Diospyros lotus TaxID=55363 RepID=UPI002256065E|nr:uncharacterized protein LOC127806014 isoform X2 [Diospyros lotus]